MSRFQRPVSQETRAPRVPLVSRASRLDHQPRDAPYETRVSSLPLRDGCCRRNRARDRQSADLRGIHREFRARFARRSLVRSAESRASSRQRTALRAASPTAVDAPRDLFHREMRHPRARRRRSSSRSRPCRTTRPPCVQSPRACSRDREIPRARRQTARDPRARRRASTRRGATSSDTRVPRVPPCAAPRDSPRARSEPRVP